MRSRMSTSPDVVRADDPLGLLEVESVLEDRQVVESMALVARPRRSWLQAIAPASVRCRAGASRGPGSGQWQLGPRAGRGWPRRAGATSGRPQARCRAAGRPAARRSRRRRGASAAGSQPGRTARARSMNRLQRRRVPSGPGRPRRRVGHDRQRTDRVLLLAGEVERRPARHDESGAGRARRSAATLAGGLERRARSCRAPAASSGRPGTAGARPTAGRSVPSNRPRRPGDGRAHLAGIVDRVEVHEPGAVRERRRLAPGQLHRQARLADAARTGQRHEAGRVEQCTQLDEVLRRGRRSSSAGPAGCRPSRRPREAAGSRCGRPGTSSWNRCSGTGHVLERRAGRGSRTATPAGRLDSTRARRRPGQHDLAAVPDRGDPRRAIDVEAAVIVTGQVRFARVEAHPDADRRAVRARHGAPGRAGASTAARTPAAGFVEGGEQRVALGPHATPPCAVTATADDPEVGGVDLVPRATESRARPIEPSTSVRRNVTVPVGRSCRGGRPVQHRPAYCRLIRSASVASIAIAASGRSRRIAFSAAPSMTRPRTPSPSAMTVAARGASRSAASSPMWSPDS